jgi:transaldolase
VAPALRNTLGIAVANRTDAADRDLLASPRWQTLSAAGAQPQRLLWASTSTKDPNAPDVLYIEALAAPDTINTIPDDTLRAFADHGHVIKIMPADGGDAEDVLGRFAKAGVDAGALAARLQREGAQSFDDSWNKLMGRLASKSGVTSTGRSTKASS